MSVIIVSPTRDYGVINSRRAGPGTGHSPPMPLVHVLQCSVFASFAAKLKHEHTKHYNMIKILKIYNEQVSIRSI